MAEVIVRKLNKMFDTNHVVKDVDLHIRDKEFVVFVGPSGCGKTTTLRMIAGLEAITSGDILIGNTVVNQVPPMDRDIAMVFQNYALYPHMSVASNMAFGLKMRKFEKPEIEKRIKRAAEILGIGELLHRKPRQLSGGQRQRVALGRAIVRDPAVFLLDEPLSNLDAHLRVQMRAEIQKVHRAVDATAVYVTHDQVEALTMGDRIVVMNDGRIHQVGTPDELYDAPINKFVASFIGTPAMGFLTCRIERSNGKAGLMSDSARMRLSEEQSRALDGTRSETLTVGIRPERLTLASGKETDAEVVIHGTVEVVEMLGAEQYVHFVADGGSLTARVPRDQPVKVDQRVTFNSRNHHLHMFDHETGLALSHRAEQERVS